MTRPLRLGLIGTVILALLAGVSGATVAQDDTWPHRDTVVPIEQSRNLADALGAAGVEFVYAELPTGHGAPQILQEQGTWELVAAFLNYQVHPEQ